MKRTEKENWVRVVRASRVFRCLACLARVPRKRLDFYKTKYEPAIHMCKETAANGGRENGVVYVTSQVNEITLQFCPITSY